jgi:hypothetical protein
MFIEGKVIEIYCRTDDFYKIFDALMEKYMFFI